MHALVTATRQNCLPEIENDDGASVWKVDRLWISAMGVERIRDPRCSAWGHGWPIMQRETCAAAGPREKHAV